MLKNQRQKPKSIIINNSFGYSTLNSDRCSQILNNALNLIWCLHSGSQNFRTKVFMIYLFTLLYLFVYFPFCKAIFSLHCERKSWYVPLCLIIPKHQRNVYFYHCRSCSTDKTNHAVLSLRRNDSQHVLENSSHFRESNTIARYAKLAK